MHAHLFHPQRFWDDSPRLFARLDSIDAELDREDSLSQRYAFKLGEDLGRYRMHPQEDFPSTEMARGFEHGLSQPPRTCDRFLRKLLSLKRNAFARSIPVSSALTTDHLRWIDVPVCPVSGEPLTHSTRTDTDWSIDRLNNELGYVPGNLCVVSRRVNRLKGTADFEALTALASARLIHDGEDGLYSSLDSGLLVIEALRLSALMAAPCALGRASLAQYAPFAMAPGGWSTMDGGLAALHVKCARTLLEGPAHVHRRALLKHLGSHHWGLSNQLVKLCRRALEQNTHPCDIWFDGNALGILQALLDGLMVKPPVMKDLDTTTLAAKMKTELRPLFKLAR